MLNYRDVVNGLHQLGLDRDVPVIAHMSTDLLIQVKGGASSILGSLLAVVDNALLPSFTLRTQVIPESGPEDNGLRYGSGRDSNLNAEIFNHNLIADEPYREMATALLSYPASHRSTHPLLSLVGLGVNTALDGQTIENPYQPIQTLGEYGGWVLLLGADQTSNFSIHLAEYLAGRKQFIRWALTPRGIVECPHFPGCPNGFNKLHYHIQEYQRRATVEDAIWQAYPLTDLIRCATELLKKDPYALLCNQLDCERCNAVRKAIRNGTK
jgi:aminoglycoside 3-N-acetyltransferase